MADKRMTADEVAAEITDGMTVGIGGWGSRRKPMALVRALLRSPARDLTIVSYGGPDVGLLCAAGKVARVVFGFVTLDSVPYDPWFGRARQDGLAVTEYDEGMLGAALSAAAQRLPFLPTRAGLGSDVMRLNPGLRTVRSPYSDGEELVAVPAVRLDVALVHLNRADRRGNAQYLGPDPYFDDLFCLAATKRYVSVEKVVDTASLTGSSAPVQSLLLNRSGVDGVVESPRGAHFTTAVPDYGRDERFQRHYVASAKDPSAWSGFVDRFLSGDEAHYLSEVDRFAGETA